MKKLLKRLPFHIRHVLDEALQALEGTLLVLITIPLLPLVLLLRAIDDMGPP